MSSDTVTLNSLPAPPYGEVGGRAGRVHPAIGYVSALGLVALTTIIAFIVENLAPIADVSLVFVLPVLIAALTFGWGPALVCALAAVGAFDFFFIEPLYTLRVGSPSDLWAMALLLIVAAIASTVAAQSRRRALDAKQAAGRAEALHALAHAVVDAAPANALCAAAGEALAKIFRAQAVVMVERAGELQIAALAGGASLTAKDEEAARWALANGLPTQGENFPFDAAEFDFWPVSTSTENRIVLGVGLATPRAERPSEPAQYIEMIGAYLAAGLSNERRGHS